MDVTERHFADHRDGRRPKVRSALRAGILLVLLSALAAAALTSSAGAASLPSVIAYEGAGGIGIVHPGHVHSARLFYAPASGGTDSPSWSPNGQTLAFGVNTPHGIGIGVVNRSGKLIDAVSLPHLVGPADLDWSPDGKQIAYLCLDGPVLTTPGLPHTSPNQFFNVCVLDVVTGAHRMVAASTLREGILCCSVGRISWSPKGDVVAVGGEHDIAPGDCIGFGCGQPDLALVDVATGTMTSLGGTDNFADPAFSPNGSEIASTSIPKGKVYVMSESGAHARRVVSPSPGGAEANWSPNGKELVYGKDGGGLYTVDVHGGKPKRATTVIAGDPTWVAPLTRCTVPKLKGQTLAAAKRLVALAGCVVGKVTGPKKNRSKRHVVDQKPAAHHDVATGTKVNIQIR
jgi:Tol biopolymer transport system component